MLSKHLGTVAALTSLGHAILLPPTISISSDDPEYITITPDNSEYITIEEQVEVSTITILPLPFEQEDSVVEGWSLKLPCPGCPVMFTDTLGRSIPTDVKNQLAFDFEVIRSFGDAEDRLTVNGMQIWPIEPTIQTLTAPQLIHTDEDTWDYAAEPQLGYSVFAKAPILSEDESLYLIKMQLEIIEVENTFIKGIPAIGLSLLRTPSGKLMLGEAIEMDVEQPTELTPSDGDQECASALCRWRAILADRLSKLRSGCGGGEAESEVEAEAIQAPPRPNIQAEEPQREDARPHPRPLGHHNRHAILRFLRTFTLHVLLPVAVGIAVGITASLIGMLVGNIVVAVWRVLFRQNHIQLEGVHQVVIVEESDDESKGFLVEEVRDLPPYTDEKA